MPLYFLKNIKIRVINMKKVMISHDGSTLMAIDDCDGKADKINYFSLIQCPTKNFDKKIKEFEEQGCKDFSNK